MVGLSQADAPQRIALSGVLQPGNYRMKYKVECTFDGDEISRDFSMNLALDCAADFNRANAVDVQDIFDFLNAWFAGDLRADANASGDLSVQDVFDFIGICMGGCA